MKTGCKIHHDRQPNCFLCKKAANDPRYHRLWGLQDEPPAVITEVKLNTSRLKEPCQFRLEQVGKENPDCGSCAVYKCRIYGECVLVRSNKGRQNCMNCPDYSTLPPKPPMNMGVVVGTYGMPQLARLQVMAIRETCGDIPILISDDCSDDAERVNQLTVEFPLVEFEGNPKRLGHYAGDLSVFRKGILWGKRRGLDAVVKLSQRLLVTRREWLTDIANLFLDSGWETVGQRCDVGSDKGLYIRTELLAMRVSAWSADDVVARLSADRLGNPTELIIHDLLVNRFGGRFHQWTGMSLDRYARTPGFLWHCANTVDEYRQYAASRGVELDAGFTTNGWQHEPNWLRG